ncbi:MAG: ParB/RepB/Spo0J family partition protein [Elusimicrobia bacterium]|nr:ParB/RepB/Spo0J family partition protein [Elusimicrobiota bacterium]
MALGKGLSALIPEKTSVLAEGGSQKIRTSLIRDNRLQPRQNYDEGRLDELAASIREQGFLQPIVVRKAADGYEVIAGERRLKAARRLKMEEVPVVVKEATDREALVLALVENVQREELNPVEKAESYHRLVDEFGYTQEDVAKSVGKDRVTIANLLRLLKLPKDILQAVSDGKVSEGHARTLLSLEDANAQMLLFLEIVQKGLSVREAEERVKAAAGAKRSAKKNKARLKDPEVLRLEEELRNILGTKVSVENSRKNKGKVVIEYYSLDDLDRILGIIRS